MTETMNHRRPLHGGDSTRTHTVGERTFTVQYVAGGSFTQASYRDATGPTTVLATTPNMYLAVAAYAAAIEQAESDAAGALDDPTNNLPMGADMTLVNGEAPTLASRVGYYLDTADAALDDEHADRQLILGGLIRDLRRVVGGAS